MGYALSVFRMGFRSSAFNTAGGKMGEGEDELEARYGWFFNNVPY